ncbi:MAG: hypothetical protein GWN87_22165, partial [Desulfuromonadales bacterium]|nr:hypothetical protein [Desulfuromonadales bacterium]
MRLGTRMIGRFLPIARPIVSTSSRKVKVSGPMALMMRSSALYALLHRQAGHVVHVDRLQPVATVSENAEGGKAPQHPGDVVDQNPPLAKHHRRAQNGMADPRVGEVFLENGLVAEVLQGGVLRRVGDADVDEALHARLAGGGEQLAAVLQGPGEGEVFGIETHPVGIVKDGGAAQGVDKPLVVVEIEGTDLHFPAVRVGVGAGVGQGPDPVAGL